MSESGGISDGTGKVLTLEDLIATIDRHERTPSNVPKVDTFHFDGERVSNWLDRVEQAMMGLSDAVKFQRIMRYVLYGHNQEVQRVVNDAHDDWARFREGMQRKYRLGDDLLTTGDLEAMNKDNFTTIGAFVQEFKKRARKVHRISEETQCAIFLGLLTASEAHELTGRGGGTPKLRDGFKGRLSRRLVPNVHLGTILPKEAEWAESGTKMDWKCVACGTLDLVVKGFKCTAMVDTGADMNIIREADAIRNTGPKSIKNRPNPGSFTIEESEGERRRLRAETKEEERIEAFSLSLSDVGKAMDMVAAHEMAYPDAIQVLREQVLECPEIEADISSSGWGRLKQGSQRRYKTVDQKCRPVPVLVTEDEEVYYERERGLIRRMKEKASAGPCRINEGNEEQLIILESDFLLPQERALMVELMKKRRCAYEFSDEERGRVDVDKISMIRIHTVPHEPWNLRGARYPNPHEEKKVVNYLDDKIRTHVADYSSGPYTSPWSDFTKTAMPRGGKGPRPPRRPLGTSGEYEQHGPSHREGTPMYDNGDIELFLDSFWEHARRIGWTVAQAIERLRGAGRFEEPLPGSVGRRRRGWRWRREEESEPEDEERRTYPECGLGPVEFRHFTEGGLRRSPVRTQEEAPASLGSLRELEAHLDVSRWGTSPRGEERGRQAEEVPREEIPREEVRDTQRERGLGDEGRRAGKEVIKVGEDTPPQTPAVGLRLGDAPGSTRQAEEGLQREEAPLPSSEQAPSPERGAERRREIVVVRRESLALIDRHLASHALEHPDLEEPAPAEPRQEPCQPEREVEAEIPKRVNHRTRERAPAGQTAEEKRAKRSRRIKEIWQERQRLGAAGHFRSSSRAAGALPGQPPSEPAKAPQIPEMWRDFWEQRGEELPSPTRAGFGVTRKAEERLDRKIKFLAKTTFDRHLLLKSDLAGKKTKEEGHGVRLEAMEVEIQELLRQGLPGQPSAAEPRQEPPMGRVILEPEEARAQREAEREAFEFRAPTELATLPIVAAGPVMPLAVEEGLPPSSSEPAQGSSEGSMDVLLEAVHTMQEEASLFSREQRIEEPLEREMGIGTEGVIEGRPQRLDTPEYGPEGIEDRPGPSTQERETGEQPLDMPQSHELSREASEAPSPGSQREKKRSRKWFDTSCFFCTKEGHRALQCPKFLKDKADGKVTEEGGRMYDRQGKRVERSADGGRAQLYR
ncbi:hypothetical protein CBR_g19997 [Chara braunii]|uniref:CCHC-type domain-containing protein n=1 Tax=Chara braunii TaxID=69332 RepID=A0A388KZC2_CHABU|nr:hypothetical protein CBR_g19997 [Chara braunii]|eukprot:GBG75368.1 hypothetical protein CBR_g19997 [Chara braunii]